MMRNDDHVFNGSIPDEIAENWEELFPEFDDLNHEEILQQQESVYQSLKGYGRSFHRNDWCHFSAHESESSGHDGFDSQLALDEALARSLEELEEDLDDLNISHSDATESREVSSREENAVTHVNEDLTQDDVDPDHMTYEQLVALGESSCPHKGLSEEVISRLPTSKYKMGFLSKQKEEKECVICCMPYKDKDKMTTLPCTHEYHKECIGRWLLLNKCCPVCKKDLSED
ncbi:RING-type E3 ubiquitin transferase [Sarracenia purpurea var. burkii]